MLKIIAALWSILLQCPQAILFLKRITELVPITKCLQIIEAVVRALEDVRDEEKTLPPQTETQKRLRRIDRIKNRLELTELGYNVNEAQYAAMLNTNAENVA